MATEFVLIETLWNVKSGEQNPARGDGSGINRNIVECKGYINLSAQSEIKY